MNQRRTDLLIVSLLAILALGPALAGGGNVVLRTLCVLPLVFVLPGYAFVAAVFPAGTLAYVERTLFSIGMSLVIAIFGGLLLHLLPWGLQTTSWAALLAGTTLFGCLVAQLRRAPIGNQPVRPAPILPARALAIYAVAGLIAISAVAVARTQAERLSVADGVQLWMLPVSNLNHPAALSDAAPQSMVQIGVHSIGSDTATYRLRLQSSGKTIREWPLITLAADGTWETTIAAASIAGLEGPVEALLYRANAPDTVYRRTLLWPNTLEQ